MPEDPDRPTHCPNGHRLRYPNVHVSWMPCDCPTALAHRTTQNPSGHTYIQCLHDKWEWREHGCEYLPPAGPTVET